MTRRLVALILTAGALAACGDSGGPSQPLFLAKVFGDSQEVEMNSASAPLQVQVVDTLGQPVEGIVVKFSLTEGSGALIARDTSGVDGVAETRFTADGTPGTRKIRAYGVLADVNFTLFVVPSGSTVIGPARRMPAEH